MTDAQQSEHCEHECVCGVYLYETVYGKFLFKQACDPTTIYIETCPCKHDTRNRPHTQAPAPEQFLTVTVGECMTQCLKARADERERLLDELYQQFICNSKTNKIEWRWSEVKEIIKSLREQGAQR